MPKYVCINNDYWGRFLTVGKTYYGEALKLDKDLLAIQKDDFGNPNVFYISRFELVEEIGENLDD